MTFWGYCRADGSVGVRNHVAIISSVLCANTVTTHISNKVAGTVSVTHTQGCAQLGADYEQTKRTLAGIGQNPNIAAVLFIGLGCEQITPETLTKMVEKSEKPIETLSIQEEGGTSKTITKGVRIARTMVQDVAKNDRKQVNLDKLILGTECGGSDTTSGLAANPALGIAADLLLKKGGTVILSETSELIGAEHLLVKRARTKEIGQKLLNIVNQMENHVITMGVDLRGSQPSPGNIAGGLTTIEEKSLGTIYKGGSAPIEDVLFYAQKPSKKGFFVMDSPGQDVESIVGMIAGGAQLIMFTTGRGSVTGSQLAPVIKITGNPRTFEKMQDDMDINVGTIITGQETLEEVGMRIFETIIHVASGELTKSEIHGHNEFAIMRIGPSL
ncbi:MAG: UxaA family hydrolase [Candidatus Heimdallarchaeota archaeon]